MKLTRSANIIEVDVNGRKYSKVNYSVPEEIANCVTHGLPILLLYRRAYLHAHDKFRRKDVRDKYYHLSFGNHGIYDIDDLPRRSGHREKVLLAQGRSFRRTVSCHRLQLRGVFIVVDTRL